MLGNTKFIVLKKNTRSMNTSERLEELFSELQQVAWDVVLVPETWRQGKEMWETQQGHIMLESVKFTNKHGVAILLNRRYQIFEVRSPRRSGLKCRSKNGQIGCNDGSVGRIWPHVFHVTRGATCGRTHLLRSSSARRRRSDVVATMLPGPKTPSPKLKRSSNQNNKILPRAKHVGSSHRGVRSEGLREEVPPTMPANFAHELAQLRSYGRTPNYVQICNQMGETENTESANSPEVHPILASIWFLWIRT